MTLARRLRRKSKKYQNFEFSAGLATVQAMEGDDGVPCPILHVEAYDGGELHVGMEYPVVLELDGIKAYSDQIPFLRNHEADDDPLGHVEDIDVHSKLTATVYLSYPSEHRDRMVTAMKAKKRWEVSIGAKSKLRLIPDGETIQANGQEFAGPILYGATSVLRELSAVNLGGAANATSAQLIAANLKGNDMLDDFIRENGFDPENITEAQQQFFQELYDAQEADSGEAAAAEGESAATAVATEQITETTTAASGVVDSRNVTAIHGARQEMLLQNQVDADIKASRKRQVDEIRRVKDIAEICAKYDNPKITVDGQKLSLDEHAIAAGWGNQQTELEALREHRPKPSFSINTGASVDNYDSQAVEAAALMLFLPDADWVSATFKGVSDKRRQQIMNNAMDSRYSQPTLSSIGHACIQANGTNQHFQIGKTDDRFLQATLDADFRARGSVTVQANATGTSTMSFSSVLENVANKLMLSAYESAETTWSRITSRATHNNFQIHTKYRIDPTGAFKKVGNDGELRQIRLGDSTFQNQLETHGGQIGVSRQMMRNDDLGAFGVVPLAFGEFTATTLEHATYLQLLNAPATFFVANENLLTGGATALSIDSVSTAREMYRNQVTPSGSPLLSTPRMMLVGTALETTAESLWTKERIGASGGAENPHRNSYEPVVSPYLNNTAIRDQDGNAITGQSSTLWFMMNRPTLGGRSAIEMAFLDGVSVPTIRSFDYQPGRLGMTYEAFIDFGVALQERTAAIRVNGA